MMTNITIDVDPWYFINKFGIISSNPNNNNIIQTFIKLWHLKIYEATIQMPITRDNVVGDLLRDKVKRSINQSCIGRR